MRLNAYGKVNISLDVVGIAENGYHLLKMIMQTVDLYDIVEITKNNENSIKIICNKPYVPTNEKNLAYKAADLFMQKYNIKQGITINIEKNIPVSGGMAGGSTDAAAVLKILNKMFNINASNNELRNMALSLGADVPYCIEGGTALCEGIGEKITQLKPFVNKILVIVKPPFGVSTKEVYKDYDMSKVIVHPNTEEIIDAMKRNDLYFVSRNMRNLLENVTLKKHKNIISIKKEMNDLGAINSMMSGSGPTVFGFFTDMVKAQMCYDEIKKKYKDVYITRTI